MTGPGFETRSYHCPTVMLTRPQPQRPRPQPRKPMPKPTMSENSTAIIWLKRGTVCLAKHLKISSNSYIQRIAHMQMLMPYCHTSLLHFKRRVSAATSLTCVPRPRPRPNITAAQANFTVSFTIRLYEGGLFTKCFLHSISRCACVYMFFEMRWLYSRFWVLFSGCRVHESGVMFQL